MFLRCLKKLPMQVNNTNKSLRLTSSLNEDYQYIERSNERTDKYKLPPRPVPRLEDTCERYLEAVRPLVDDNQFRNTEKFVNDFKLNVGKELSNHYIYNYWDEFLDKRISLCKTNPYIMVQRDPIIHRNPVLRATTLLISLLRYRRSLIDKVLTPEKIDMSPLNHLFSTTRMPREGKDTLEHFGDNEKHVVFLCNGIFYKFEALDENGNIRSPQDIYNFIYNLNEHEEQRANESITAFGTLDRDNWAKVRRRLEKLTEKNRLNLKIIDSALTIVCLDQEPFELEDSNGIVLGGLLGSYNYRNVTNLKYLNRWLDKPIQLIISKNGDAGINFEHSWSDAEILLNLLNKVYVDSIKVNKIYLNDLNPEPQMHDIAGHKLNFDLDDELKSDLSNAFEEYKKFVAPIRISVFDFDVDKNYLKSKSISPDFVVQMAVQLAYYKMFKRTVTSIEACSTANFKLGRADHIRSSTMETKLACKSLALGDKKFTITNLREILHLASKKHEELCRLARHGQCFDRHLTDLEKIARNLNKSAMPAIFEDPSYKLAFHFTLSSSQALVVYACSGGFVPDESDGYGIAYGFTEKGLSVSCSGLANMKVEQYSDALVDSLQEIKNILEICQP